MATKANLVIDQGTSYSTTLTLTDDNGDPLALNGFTANSQMRKWYTSVNPAAVFATSINTTSAVVTLSLTANQTSSLTAGRYVYDVELTDTYANTISRIVEGIVTVTPQVTR
jgi:hypothetical protein